MASTSANVDTDDLDPAKFLQSVRELSEKREREDLERYRKLEEQIAADREARQQRRLERARSISPTKDSASGTPRSARSRPATPIDVNPLSSPPNTSTPASLSNGNMAREESFQRLTGTPSDVPHTSATTLPPPQISDRAPSPTKASPRAATPSPSNTLSWQRRPTSSGRGSRPLSMIATENAAKTPRDLAEGKQDDEPSRTQIAASLSGKDPSWFRQTADRGLGSAAFRENQVGDMSVRHETPANKMQLPGLSREPSIEPERQASSNTESIISVSPSRAGSVRDSAFSSRFSDQSKADSKYSLPSLHSQKLPPPTSDRTSSTDGEQSTLGRTLTMSSSQARLAGATDRPASPTKGMGGFVQSAMMKRSDSVSKRWSQQPGTGLSRHNSTTSIKSGIGSFRGFGALPESHSMPKLESSSGETSAEPRARPNSSHGNLATLSGAQETGAKDGFVKPAVPHHSRSKSVASSYGTSAGIGKSTSTTSPPASPSKRWSPTKSSWLENAINKPESPKPAFSQATQPSWMTELSKAKAQRTSADSTPRNTTPKQIETPELGRSPVKTPTAFGPSMLKRTQSKDMRSESPIRRSVTPPTKAKPPSLTGRPASTLGGKPTPEASPVKVEEVVKEADEPAGPEEPLYTMEEAAGVNVADAQPRQQTPPVASPPATTSRVKLETPLKNDLRGTLKPRQAPTDPKSGDQPEFLSAFGKLKRTRTENYVAPDELKNNVMRGKAGLAFTGGPQKTQRQDEFKEDILTKKKEMQAKAADPAEKARQVSGPPQTPTKPEALAQRELLGGKPGSTSTHPSPEKNKDATPEALARHRSLKENPKPHQPPEKQVSAPGRVEGEEPSQTSRLAARFNPALASVLMRGPPAASAAPKEELPRSISPLPISRASVPAAQGSSDGLSGTSQLSDVRKGRAKGPKRRKPGVKEGEPEQEEKTATAQLVKPKNVIPSTPAKPLKWPTPKSSAFVEKELPSTPTKVTSVAALKLKPNTEALSHRPAIEKPSTAAKSPLMTSEPIANPATKSTVQETPLPQTAAQHEPASNARIEDVPVFKGFGATQRPKPAPSSDENKENTNGISGSVRNVTSFWTKQAAIQPVEARRSRSPIKLPSRKDEEAAMRSAGLLASSPARPSSRESLGISADNSNGSSSPSKEIPKSPSTSATLPPRPTKSSRIVSGSLQESSPNKGSAPVEQDTAAHHLLRDFFGSVPAWNGALGIDARALLREEEPNRSATVKTLRKSIQEITAVGNILPVPPEQEYILYEDCTYVCTHVYGTAGGAKTTEVFLWIGRAIDDTSLLDVQAAAKRIASNSGAELQTVRQYLEPAAFFQALGGILVTRRCREKRYLLRGRKHLGHIVFDEVDFHISSLCPGYPHLLSHPVTLQETRVYLWTGSACSAEELGSARLVGTELSAGGEMMEVGERAEPAHFLHVFGPGTTKQDVPASAPLWRHKATAPHRFAARLFAIEPAAPKPRLLPSLSSIFARRRPSWQGRSPSPARDDASVAAREIAPFAQQHLEPEGMYLLDAFAALYVVPGPLAGAQAGHAALLGQTLRLAGEYARVAGEGRGLVLGCWVVLCGGVPGEVKALFRLWEERRGAWGTGGLMAGSAGAGAGRRGAVVPVEDVLAVVCGMP